MSRSTTALRRDTQETRNRLLDATGELLAEQGLTFGLPELSRRGGVATATIYRHFATVHDAVHQFYLRLAFGLVDQLAQMPRRGSARSTFDAACEQWTEAVSGWGRAATQIRSVEGFLERVRRNDEPTTALYSALAPILTDLIEHTAIPAQDLDYAILTWITLFDERVIVDLMETKQWSPKHVARQLGRTVLAALSCEPVCGA